MLKTNIDKKSQKAVTKESKRQERGKKSTQGIHEEGKRKNTRG